MKFLVDFMCGRLAKWMRLAGYDTEYYKKGDMGIIKKAREEHRIIITRNSHLAGLPDVIFLTTEDVFEQLDIILKRFPEKRLLTRCPLCNTELIKVNREQTAGNIPLYVWNIHDYFYYCPKCKKFYWEGTHTKEIKSRLESIYSL